MVKTGSRIILKVFNIDSYRFWVTESENDLSFALRLIFKVTTRSKVKKIKTGSWLVFNGFNIDSYRFLVAESEYDLSFALRIILTSQWRHKHVSLFSCLKTALLTKVGLREKYWVSHLQTWSVYAPRFSSAWSSVFRGQRSRSLGSNYTFSGNVYNFLGFGHSNLK